MTIRRQLFLAAGVVLALLLSGGAAAAAERPSRYILPGDAVYPEGIAYQKSTGHFYVGSTTDGTIFRGHVGDPEAEVWLPGNQDGRTTATGLDVDTAGRLFVSGGGTGKVFIYDTSSGALLAALQAANPAGGPTFINDVTVTRSGDAFATDSLRPVIYRIYQTAPGQWAVQNWLNLDGTAIQYVAGFNLNGILATPDGKYLIVVQSNTGKLFRIGIPTRLVNQIDLDGTALTAGDGLALRGNTLYVVRNSLGQIAVVQLAARYGRGEVVDVITDPSFRFPTTAAIAQDRLLVVNAQFNRRGTPEGPELPFTVSAVDLR
jgi:Cu-Zn family superoxide dismutase